MRISVNHLLPIVSGSCYELHMVTSDTLRAFGVAVRKARVALGLTLADVAHDAFGNRDRKGYLSEIENGKRSISPLTAGKLAEALDLRDEVIDSIVQGSIEIPKTPRVDLLKGRESQSNLEFHGLSLGKYFDDTRNTVVDLLSDPRFPKVMAMGQKIVPNPAWQDPTNADVEPERAISDRVIAHMFLAVKHLKGDRARLLCFWSTKWESYFVPFVKIESLFPTELTEEEAIAVHVAARFGGISKPLQKSLISAKSHQEFKGETWLYAFTFHSLVLNETLTLPEGYRWLTMERLTDPNERESVVNGDVLRAIRANFGQELHGLDRSSCSTIDKNAI